MEAIGLLAGGVAHDFNNILTIIIGYGTLLAMDGGLTGPHQEHIEQILSSADRAAQLTSSLLAFSRKQEMVKKPADLNFIVRNVQKFLLRVIGEDVSLNVKLPDSTVLPVHVDSGQIEQVLINLATNGRDAMPGGGVLSIEAGLQEIEVAQQLDDGLCEPGQYAWLAVSDNGIGMDEDTCRKIFEPFFTTKEVGKGTGLGMSIVYGIVRQHNGFINVHSEPGAGTTFRIYIPLDNTGQDLHREKAAAAIPQGGGETILLADDDADVRRMIESLLTRFGYNVVLAVDGDEAVSTFATHQDRVGLILMDMIMPKKNGIEAFKAICGIKPAVKILYLSGYTSDFISNHGFSWEENEIIMKPVQPMELLRRVREMLDAH